MIYFHLQKILVMCSLQEVIILFADSPSFLVNLNLIISRVFFFFLFQELNIEENLGCYLWIVYRLCAFKILFVL